MSVRLESSGTKKIGVRPDFNKAEKLPQRETHIGNMVLGAAVGFLASQAIGFAWYHPAVFGNARLHAEQPGKTMEEYSKTLGGLAFPSAILSHVALAAITECSLNYLNVNSVAEGVQTAVGMATLIALADACHAIFSKKPAIVFIIDHAFDATILAAMAACIMHFK